MIINSFVIFPLIIFFPEILAAIQNSFCAAARVSDFV